MSASALAVPSDEQDLLDCVYTMIMITDRQGGILYANPQVENNLGYKKDSLYTKNLYDLIYDNAKKPSFLEYVFEKNGQICKLTTIENICIDVIVYVKQLNEQLIFTFKDVSKQIQLEAKLENYQNQPKNLHTHDSLTLLPNAFLLHDRVNQLIKMCLRENKLFALLYLDIHNFNEINQNYGYPVGDKALKAMAHELTITLRRVDTISRYEDDAFMVVLNHISCEEDAERLAKLLLGNLQKPYNIDNNEVKIEFNIGISLFPRHGESVEALCTAATKAEDAAKRNQEGYQIAR